MYLIYFIFFFFFFFKQKTAYEIASCLVGSEMCIRTGLLGYPRQKPLLGHVEEIVVFVAAGPVEVAEQDIYRVGQVVGSRP